MSEPIDLADVAAILEGNPKAVLFRAVGAERQELVGNVTGSRARIARAFGVAPGELLPELLRRLRNKPEIVEVARAQAPVQEVVLTGDDADLTTLPVHLGHGADGGPYISASIDYVIDPQTGWTNVGVRRLMLRGRREAGIDLVSPSDLRAIYEASAAAGKPLPVSFVVGAHPIDHVAAVMRLPVDELGLVAALRDAPLPVVKCVTNDIRVPADAEWVLEGYLDARGHVEPEGPYGEFLGYYGALKRNPVFHLTADHAPPRRAVPDLDHRRRVARTHRHRAAQRAAHRGDDLARARDRGARAARGPRHRLERRHVQPARGAAPARAGRGAQRHRRLLRRAGQRQERVRGRSRHRHLLRRADGLGAGHPLPARPRPGGDGGMRTLPLDPLARPAARGSAPRPAST